MVIHKKQHKIDKMLGLTVIEDIMEDLEKFVFSISSVCLSYSCYFQRSFL